MIAASQGQIGSLVDQVVLWCYDYDPVEGSYVANAWRLMRLGGALTVFVMLALLLPYWFGKGRVPRSAGIDGKTAVDPQATSA